MRFDIGFYYHLYNRSNTKSDLIFKEDKNYTYFLDKFSKYLDKYLNIYCYCLIPNHFHFIVRIKPEKGDLIELNEDQLSDKIIQSLKNFLNSYTKSFNKLYIRRGSLFQKNTKLKCVTSESYIQYLVRYIHRNPIEMGLVSKLEDWKYSSYYEYLFSDNCRFDTKLLDDLYINKQDFIAFTNKSIDDYEKIYELFFK